MDGMLFTTAGQLIGIVLASYGLIRESFATLAQSRPYGEGRFGEGRFGGTIGHLADSIVAAAAMARLLPNDRSLTLTDR